MPEYHMISEGNDCMIT